MTRPASITHGREHTGDRQTDEIWRRLGQIAEFLNGNPFLNGRLISEEHDAETGSGLAFTAGTTRTIPHRLGRPARGFLECYPADVPSAAHCGLRPVAYVGSATPERFLSVQAASTGVCFIWCW